MVEGSLEEQVFIIPLWNGFIEEREITASLNYKTGDKIGGVLSQEQ